MAQGGGTPIRKSPAKKGPTKAAALKTLGLTQEDLDAIKELRDLREQNATVSAAPTPVDEDPLVEKLDQDAPTTGEAEEVSDDRKLINVGWSAAAPQATAGPDASTAETDEPVFYMRNLRGVEVRFRLSRQKKDEKATLLKPRGSRGDMIRLEPADLKDAELRTQVAYQLVEIIPEGEALAAIDKQATNASQPGYRAIEAMLTNERGEKMLQEGNTEVVKTDLLPFEQQGITVAKLNPQENSPTGELPSKGKGIDWDKARQTDPVQQGVGSGPIVQDASPEALAAAKDAVARRKDVQGPKAGGLAGMKVSVDPVQKT